MNIYNQRLLLPINLSIYLFIVLVILLQSCTLTNAQLIRNITFGQSAAFSGISGELGIQMRKGIEAAFHVLNQEGLSHPVLSTCPDTNSLGVQLKLISYDDQYEEAPAVENTRRLINEDNVFALIGSIGTPTTVAARPIAKAASVPIVGPVTGSMSLREPYDPYIVNIRASYNDETAAMVQYLTEVLGIAKISIFYQNDAFGMAGFSGLSRALSYAGLTLESMGTFTRNSLAVEAGLANITLGRPQAIVMIGTYGPLAKFVKLAKTDPSLHEAYFLTVSFVGSEEFKVELDGVFDRIIVTQVVPLPFDDSLLLVKNYHKAMMNYSLSNGEVFDPAVNSTFFSLEGYMLGNFVAVALQRTQYNLSVPNFLDAIYETAIFSLGGLRLGPYGPNCTQSFTGCRCNQGMHEVFITSINEEGEYYEIPGTDFSFSTCGYTPPLHLPIAFGQSQKFTPILNVTEQEQYRNGIRASFAEFNEAQVFPRNVLLVTFANSSAEDNSNYASELVARGAFALLGDSGQLEDIIYDSNNLNVPLIGIMSGSMDLRRNNSYTVNIRASYNDEAAAAVAYVNRYNFTQVAIFYERDNVWAEEGVNAIDLAMSAANLQPVLRSTFWLTGDSVSFENADALNTIRNVQVVLIAATNAIATTQLITTTRIYGNPNFVCLSTVSVGQMQTALWATYRTSSVSSVANNKDNASGIVEEVAASYNNIHFTQPTPSVTDTSSPFVLAYHAAMADSFPGGYTPSQISLEGYLVGRFTTIAISRVDSTMSPTSFINAIYSSATFQVNDITLGPFSIDSESPCNQGSRDVFLLKLGLLGELQADPINHFRMTTCGVDYTTPEKLIINNPMAVKWVFVAIAFAVVIIALFGLVLTVVGRKMKVVRVKSEVYCYLVCIGVIIAVSSVLVKGWETESQSARDRQCMAGAWTMLIGYALTMACLLASSIEIYTYFRRGVEPNKVKLSNVKVGIIVTCVFFVALLLIILYTTIDPLKSTLKSDSSNGNYYTCTSKHTTLWMAAIYSIMGAMGAGNAIITFLTRGYQAPFISVFIGYSVYNVLFLAVIILPLRLLVVSDQVAAFVLESIGFLFGGCFTLFTTLGIPYYNEFFSMSSILKSGKPSKVWSEESLPSSLSSSLSSSLTDSTSGLIKSSSIASSGEIQMQTTTSVIVKSSDDDFLNS